MRRIRFEVWLVALILVTQLYAALVPANSLMEWFRSDDAFYYFKTAQNITEGRGITFDGLGRDSGFHPLWMAVLVPVFALARFDLVLPLRLVVVISTLLTAGTSVLIYRLGRRWLAPPAGGFAALLWAFHPLVYNDVIQMGLESTISGFCIALLVYRLAAFGTARSLAKEEDSLNGIDRGWMLVTGLIGALTVLARLDNIFLVCVAGAWLAIRPGRMRALLIADTFLTALGVCWAYMTRVGFGPAYAPVASSAMIMAAAAVSIRLPAYLAFGLYRRPAPGLKGLGMQLVKAALASSLSTALLAGLMLLLNQAHLFSGFPRLTLAYEAGAGLLTVLVTRLAAGIIDWRQARPEPGLRWQPTLARLAYFFLPVALLLGAYMAGSLAYFGTPMPVSGQIKRWWGTLITIYGRPVTDLAEMLGFFQKNSPWALASRLSGWPAAVSDNLRHWVYGLIALALLLVNRKRAQQAAQGMALFPLLAGSLIQLVSYTGTGYVALRPWYWVSHILLITLSAGILVDAGLCAFEAASQRYARPARRQGRFGLPVLAQGTVALLAALVVINGVYGMVHNMRWIVGPSSVTDYLGGAQALESRTEPGSKIGSTGGGVIAYFIQGRTIVNMDGLMNTNAYFTALQNGTAKAYLDHIGLNYVFASEYVVTQSDPYFQYKDRLHKIGDIGGATLFRWGAE